MQYYLNTIGHRMFATESYLSQPNAMTVSDNPMENVRFSVVIPRVTNSRTNGMQSTEIIQESSNYS